MDTLLKGRPLAPEPLCLLLTLLILLLEPLSDERLPMTASPWRRQSCQGPSVGMHQACQLTTTAMTMAKKPDLEGEVCTTRHSAASSHYTRTVCHSATRGSL